MTTVSNLAMPYTVMVPTIALYNSGVEDMVSPVSFLSRPHLLGICFCFFLTLF